MTVFIYLAVDSVYGPVEPINSNLIHHAVFHLPLWNLLLASAVLREMVVISPFYRWELWGTEKFTYPSGRARSVFKLPTPSSLFFPELLFFPYEKLRNTSFHFLWFPDPEIHIFVSKNFVNQDTRDQLCVCVATLLLILLWHSICNFLVDYHIMSTNSHNWVYADCSPRRHGTSDFYSYLWVTS